MQMLLDLQFYDPPMVQYCKTSCLSNELGLAKKCTLKVLDLRALSQILIDMKVDESHYQKRKMNIL